MADDFTDSRAETVEDKWYAAGDTTGDHTLIDEQAFMPADPVEDTSTFQDVSVPEVEVPVPQRMITSTGWIAPGNTVKILNRDLARDNIMVCVSAPGAQATDVNTYAFASFPDPFVAAEAAGGPGYQASNGRGNTGAPQVIAYNGELWIHAFSQNTVPLFYIVQSLTV